MPAGTRAQIRLCMLDPTRRLRLRALVGASEGTVQRWDDADVVAEVLRQLTDGRLEAIVEERVSLGAPERLRAKETDSFALGPAPEDLRRLRGRARGSGEPLRITAAPRAAHAPAAISGAVRSTTSAATIRGGARGAGAPARVGGMVRAASVPLVLTEGEE